MTDQSSTPHVLDRVQNACAAIVRPVSLVGVIGMLVAAAATVADILMRWTVSSGVVALNEIVTLSFVVAVTATLPAGLAAGAGITVDLMEGTLTRRFAAWLKALGAILLLLFLGLLAWRLGIFSLFVLREGRGTIILNVPMGPFFIAAAVLIGLAAVMQAAVAANLVRLALTGPFDRGERIGFGMWLVLVGIVAVAALTIYGYFDFRSLAGWAQAHPGLAVVAAFVVMWVLLMALVPLAAVLGLVGLVGCALFVGFPPSLGSLATETTGFLSNYQVATLPLFLMMGSFAAVAGISDDVYRLSQALLGSFRGGLAMATIGGCAGFGAVTGSSLPTVAIFGRMSLPQMRERNYAPEFAAGCVAAGGTLGALIPPSSILILYALLTESSIGTLFIAAIVPGLLAMVLYLITVALVVRAIPSYAPEAISPQKGELMAAVKQSGPVLLLFGVVIGGMYAGYFTATEAAAVGAVGAFLIALLRGKLGRRSFFAIMAETTASTAMIYLLIFGVVMFSLFAALSDMPSVATAFVRDLDWPPAATIALLLVGYLLLGCVMDSVTIMLITVPMVMPLITGLGYDLIWWGVVTLVVVEAGLVTPPFGMHLFILRSIAPDISLQKLYKGVLPFCAADVVKLALLLAFPALVLWLPSTMAN